jgi:hypothetical protein
VIWRVVNNLAGVDAPTTDRPFLYEDIDVRAWLEELRAGG